MADGASEVDAATGYAGWAQSYDGDDGLLKMMTAPVVQRLIGGVVGLDVVDIGCGTGSEAIRLAAEGGKVTAVDISEPMLAVAQGKDADAKVNWVTHDARSRLPLEDASADRVLCSLVATHLDKLDPLLAEAARILRPGGHVALVDLHPTAALLGFRLSYSDDGGPHAIASASHRVADYVMAAQRAGLVVDSVEEHLPGTALDAELPLASQPLDCPLLLAIRATAPGQPSAKAAAAPAAAAPAPDASAPAPDAAAAPAAAPAEAKSGDAAEFETLVLDFIAVQKAVMNAFRDKARAPSGKLGFLEDSPKVAGFTVKGLGDWTYRINQDDVVLSRKDRIIQVPLPDHTRDDTVDAVRVCNYLDVQGIKFASFGGETLALEESTVDRWLAKLAKDRVLKEYRKSPRATYVPK